jgi:hypothetical protein
MRIKESKLKLEVGRVYMLFYNPQMIKTVEITDIVRVPDGDILIHFKSQNERYESTVSAVVFKSMHKKALGFERLTSIEV